jgi:hypothetical protein
MGEQGWLQTPEAATLDALGFADHLRRADRPD